ncbi:hypothetical protein ACODT3_11005 [Streptomyces sp. 4.24]|uniref:hypothetical protein n=1 Tax=Streptomyces tritrimontium TaxID=3406573 RepID=UPI003BB6B5F0
MVRNHTNLWDGLEGFLVPHLRSGRIGAGTAVVQGFDHAVDAFRGMPRGENPGKMLVRPDV